MDNRHALIVDCKVTQATGGADKNDDTRGFVAEMRRIGMTPHVAQNTSRSGGSAIDGRTTRHEGYAKSINARHGIEKVSKTEVRRWCLRLVEQGRARKLAKPVRYVRHQPPG
jgi:hypothetical protein